MEDSFASIINNLARQAQHRSVIGFLSSVIVLDLTVFFVYKNVPLGSGLFVVCLLLTTALGCILFYTFRLFKKNTASMAVSMNQGVAQSEDRYQELVETPPDAIVVTDLKGTIIMCNECTLELYGYENHHEFLHQNGFNLVAPEDRERTKVILQELLQKKRMYNIEYQTIRKNSSHFSVSANASILTDSTTKKPYGTLCVIRDVKKEKAIERSKVEFIALPSHQLRTPLSQLRWTLEMLKKKEFNIDPIKHKKYHEDMYSGVLRLIQLVKALLIHAHLESGGTYKVVDFEPKKVTDEIVKEWKSQATQKHIRIYTTYGDIPPIYLGLELFKQALVNLFSNAILYSKESREIHINCGRRDSNILLSITDTGIGIPASEQHRVFENFFRAESARTAVTQGTGIGLHLTKIWWKVGAVISGLSQKKI